ncbi:MAG TPA: N-acetylmuramoyl-L-alanine amidase [Micropepsaceae bacterium]|jgi:N-acetylmuramoyl-L-alanine amidase|nr:N-acetylmuramoyl-L-alanine amidase [Micropepsaceae bacterium]
MTKRPLECVAAPSPNFDARPKATPVDILVLHYTGMQTAAEAIARLCDPDAQVSAHYTVDEDGTVYAHVPEDSRAWHAGVSYWAGARDINARSIGIEIVNPGHAFGYRSFPDRQIEAVIALSLDVFARHPIPPERVLGHSDVAPARKQDPGELFPWGALSLEGVGLWPQTRKLRLDVPFADGLRAFGYGMRPDVDVADDTVIAAFQRHWRPARIDGVADRECEAILAALLQEIDLTR